MHITATETDTAVLRELGHRIAQARLAIPLKQAQLAQKAGIGPRTMERLEQGGSVQLITLIRVLRELGLLANINELLPESGPRPLDYLTRRGRPRMRAPRAMRVEEPRAPWKWGDEQ